MFNSSHFLCGSSNRSISLGFYYNYSTGLPGPTGPYGLTNQSDHSIAVGNNAGQYNQGTYNTAIGFNAGYYNQFGNSIAIGNKAGFTQQGYSTLAFGSNAGQSFQGGNAIAIGAFAGSSTQGGNAIALGAFAGNASQSANSVALGSFAGSFKQGSAAIAIGSFAGYSLQGVYSICIGNGAGSVAAPGNSIILNAGSSALNPTFQNAFYVAPVRNDPTNTTNWLAYNTATSEITSFSFPSSSSATTFSAAVAATSTTSGSVVISGGLGVAGNIFTGGIGFGSNYYNYVSWTDCGYTFGNAITTYSGASLGTNPTIDASSTFKYEYSVNGNIMKLNFLFNSTVAGTDGSGVYYFNLPSGYTLNTSLVALNTSNPLTTAFNFPTGSNIGIANLVAPAFGASMNACVVPITNTQVAIYIGTTEGGGGLNSSYQCVWHSSASIFSFGKVTCFSWNATFPIN